MTPNKNWFPKLTKSNEGSILIVQTKDVGLRDLVPKQLDRLMGR